MIENDGLDFVAQYVEICMYLQVDQAGCNLMTELLFKSLQEKRKVINIVKV
jgi:hypothetical protein